MKTALFIYHYDYYYARLMILLRRGFFYQATTITAKLKAKSFLIPQRPSFFSSKRQTVILNVWHDGIQLVVEGGDGEKLGRPNLVSP